MTKHFFTSDTHFYHHNIIRYCNRPFIDKDHMNSVLIENWNKAVSPDDTVWHLGDVSFGKPHETLELLSQLNGKINLIPGNHDRFGKAGTDLYKIRCNILPEYVRVQLANRWFILCHFPFAAWERGHINLHGHTHGIYPGKQRQHDVGVDVNNFVPISVYDAIERAMKNEELPKY